ncbi:prolyl oligopeptidase family protein [Chromobacterium sp. IIBBL 290-4]|uniref:prolyl oligopeptidase family serine peptidase n=1 Tax=Chromobacterium sp. IIBBL 290-4 TaxID=2953890 RepID=UPI0020B83342|nr:prolyl oligopeptidase family serine peptidase [Chromobacterium sp. IIBBL 290-4]UTH72604.1 prolyl oligopeptidase family serine peptidase [Chromobacterium sp. IIBBL 290-4]
MKSSLLALGAAALAAQAHAAEDPNLWLESIQGKDALQWVKQQNAATTQELESWKHFSDLRQDILSILNSSAKIPGIQKIGDRYYNFWRDATHTRGVWRSTTLDEYRKAAPQWETVLDLDQLAKDEKENWVWQGANCVEPQEDRCLIRLSRGGGDAAVVREFDLAGKRFIGDGFVAPEAKSQVDWKDRDTVYISTDFGPGSLTNSGYPRIVKEWKRGQPLADAKQLFAGEATDISVGASHVLTQGREYDYIQQGSSFFTNELYLRQGEDWKKLDKPGHVETDFFGDWLLLKPRQEWKTGGHNWKPGSLLAIKLADYQQGKRDFVPLFLPTATTSLGEGSASTRDTLILNIMDNVKSRLQEWKVVDGKWQSRKVDAPSYGSIGVSAVDSKNSDDYFFTFTDFLTPTTLSLAHAGSDAREPLKQQPAFFNASGLEIHQYFARSNDGTRVPYFVIGKKGLKLDGKNPTLLYGYGGFEVSMTPYYSGSMGKAWLERGGVYVLANIRGGGEYGPQWHDAALKHKRQKAYDDFSSIAKDLAHRKIADARHLGIKGGSNGGLLMGVMLTKYPELFNAIVCQVPLLDMKRFNKLLAGASWMDEYGNPDKPEDWAFIKRYSPYQNIKPGAKYPATLFVTSTLDDRVHPGHARKMFAAMKKIGADVRYYERTEGGHGAAANYDEEARIAAMEYTFLWHQLR